MISTIYSGRTGNNLFQFAFSAIVSELSGVPFIADEIIGFPETQGYQHGPKIGREPYDVSDILMKFNIEELVNIIYFKVQENSLLFRNDSIKCWNENELIDTLPI